MSTWVFPGLPESDQENRTAFLDKVPELVLSAKHFLGSSLSQNWFEPEEALTRPAAEYAALLVEQVLHYYEHRERSGKDADFLIGIGLGEVSALCASGAMPLEDGLTFTQTLAQGMAHSEIGAMLSVFGIGRTRIQEVLGENELGNLQVAAVLGPCHHFLSGPPQDLQMAQVFLEMDDLATIQFLNHHNGPYPRLGLPEHEALQRGLSPLRFAPCTIPVISTTQAKPFTPNNVVAFLGKQWTHPLAWEASMTYLENQGQTALVFLGEPSPLSESLAQSGLAVRSPDKPKKAKLNHGPSQNQSKGLAANVSAESLGCAEFKRDYGLRYAYLAGAMYKGIASKELVVRMGKAGLMGYFGAGGIGLDQIDDTIRYIQGNLSPQQAYGMNLLCNPASPETEERTVELYLSRGVRFVEAASYLSLTPALVRYRLTGIRREAGGVVARNHVLAKVSRPEIAIQFMQPAPPEMVRRLVTKGCITAQEASLAAEIPLAHDICVESDSGGHTDQGIALVLLPAICRLRDQIMAQNRYCKPIRVGAAGGIGSPEAVAAVFMLGAAFVLTGSINQCTVEAGISEPVKGLLQNIGIQDTAYAPAPDFFEVGGKVQVVGKGSFFSARANKLYQLYQRFGSLDEIDEATKKQIQEQFFGKSFAAVWRETRDYFLRVQPEEVAKAERHPKHKMALVFKWYYVHTGRAAMKGDLKQKYDYQVHCGPALGSFNQWVQGSDLQNWQDRHVDQIATRLMEATAGVLTEKIQGFLSG